MNKSYLCCVIHIYGLSDTSPDEGLIEDLTVEAKAVEQLAEGLLSHYLPDLQRSKQALQELTQNQVILLDTLEQEISKFKECHSMLDINALFAEAKHYHTKLVNIRKEMIMLHEKTSKLKVKSIQKGALGPCEVAQLRFWAETPLDGESEPT